MVKYLVTKASKIARRNARRAKDATRIDWTRRDDEPPRRDKPANGTARRVACIVLALAMLPVLAIAGAAPTYARGSHSGGSHGHGLYSVRMPHEKNTR